METIFVQYEEYASVFIIYENILSENIQRVNACLECRDASEMKTQLTSLLNKMRACMHVGHTTPQQTPDCFMSNADGAD